MFRFPPPPPFQTITSLKKKKFAAPPGQVEVVSGCAQMGRNVARPATISAKVESAISLHATKQKRARTAGGARRLYQHQGQRSEEHTSELQSPCNLVCRLLLEKKKT